MKSDYGLSDEGCDWCGKRGEAVKKIDVDEIMQEIRDDINVRQIDGTVLPFEEIEIASGTGLPMYKAFSYQRLSDIDNYMNSHYEISTDILLMEAGGASGKAKSLIKKAVRKCLIPIVGEQNSFNAYTTRAMNMLMSFVQESIRHKQKVWALQQQVEDCQKQIAALQDQVRRMEEDKDQ